MWRIIVIIYFLFIAVLHLIPSTSLPEVSFSDLFQLDKLVHAFLFAGAFLVLYKYCLQYLDLTTPRARDEDAAHVCAPSANHCQQS